MGGEPSSADERSALKRLGLGAFIAYLLLPQIALFVLVGVASSWWLGAGLAVAWLGAWLYVRRLAREAEDSEPLPYSQWTRYLVVQPSVEALPAAVFAPVAIILAIAAEASLAETVAIAIGAILAGLMAGRLLWRWLDKRYPGEGARKT